MNNWFNINLGDAMLAGPMIVSPGQETAKVKEVKAPIGDCPSPSADRPG